ncbi:hypothetical protein LPB73_07615 [Tardiphaga sp. 37S4]|uniref:hypothetical protein n=1 Tax=Tardiphaga sp. 37S4 TaxID=1404741 RepID=UPI001E2D9975|nr:hypothetical protein [Tardiphaga sp. 37S4]UFS77235.1 hypothetical protein LPB73_07615 [Tardiphaga sp. 37S4]
MFSGLAGAALLKVLEALFNAFGTSLNTWLEKQRNEQALKDLGRVTAERDQQTEAREATERELEAAQNAPQTVDDAIARLEEGSA